MDANLEPEETTALELQPKPVVPDLEDDFGDEKLGERQPAACSMEEGCIVCQ